MLDVKSVLLAPVRALWRQLPVTARRAAARRLLMANAPSLPTPAPQSLEPTAPRIVVGFLTSPSGLGQAARLAYRGFDQRGLETYGVDLSAAFFEGPGRVDFPFRNARHHIGPARVLINVNAPYMAYAFKLLGRRFMADKHIMAYWAWELESAPKTWAEGLAYAHEIATPSAFVAEAVRRLGGTAPIHVAPHPVDLEPAPPPPQRSGAGRPFEVAFAFNVASGFTRKNPLALIRAYRKAFGGRSDRRLRILATNPEHYRPARSLLEDAAAGDHTIALTFETLSREDYFAWLGRPDLYASLHRAEGFGLGLAEAMCRGIPTLATGWSANSEFLNANNSLVVPYRLVPVVDDQAKYEQTDMVWAEPDEDAAAALLRRAADEPNLLVEMARTARLEGRAIFGKFDL